MKELEKNELMWVDGGMPMATYMNDATIAQNGKILGAIGDGISTAAGFVWGFIDGLFNLN